jgi:hypothetical protein
MSAFQIVAMSLILMGLVYFLAIGAALRARSPLRQIFAYPLVCSFVMTSGFLIWGLHAIFTSTSSTAAVGLIFLPIYSLGVAVVGFLIPCAFAVIVFVLTDYRRDGR